MDKTAFKIFISTTAIAASTAVLLLLINFFSAGVLITDHNYSTGDRSETILREAEQALICCDGQYRLESPVALPEDCWLALIDLKGELVWSIQLPGYIPRSYSINDIAVMSRWYLCDHPVYVRTTDLGLLVLGLPRESLGKYQLQYTMAWFDSLPRRLLLVIAVDLVVAFLLAALLGAGLYRRLKQIWSGISSLGREEAVELPERGLTASVAAAINRCSQALRRKDRALAERDKARINWVNGISHDIRTPLAVIMGQSELLLSSSDGDTRRAGELIASQSLKVKHLVEDLDLMSSLENDMQPQRKAPLRLCPTIRQAASDAINSCSDPGYQVELELLSPAACILGDQALLQRAFFNLISNSFSHNAAPCTLHIRLEQLKSSLHIHLQDDGCGVPQEVLDSLDTMPGTAHGMGLPMAYRIILAHGGSFSCGNDKGFFVDISLPALQP